MNAFGLRVPSQGPRRNPRVRLRRQLALAILAVAIGLLAQCTARGDAAASAAAIPQAGTESVAR